jgi:hypothetical protein
MKGLVVALGLALLLAAFSAPSALAQSSEDDPYGTPDYLRDPAELAKPPRKAPKRRLATPGAEPAGQNPVNAAPQGPPQGLSKKLYQGRTPSTDCVPGQDAGDPKCCQALNSLCRTQCQHEYRINGDISYLNKCERSCEARTKLCEEPPKRDRSQ